MENKLHILGIAGSLRKGSYNKAILENAIEFAPENVEIELFAQLGDIPLFNQDNEKNPPESVVLLKQKIRESDAIIFATPEYNYSIPGVLKNAIDWASRPYGDSAWDSKPAAIMSAATGMIGGARAQYHLRQIFVFLNLYSLNKPEVIIPNVNEKVNVQGQITDDYTKEKIQELIIALADWTTELKEKVIPAEEMVEKYPYEQHYSRSQQ